MIAGVLCVCLSFVSCNRAICMILVCIKCVNCSILFLIPSILSATKSIKSILSVCSIIGRWKRGAGGCLEGAVVVGLE